MRVTGIYLLGIGSFTFFACIYLADLFKTPILVDRPLYFPEDSLHMRSKRRTLKEHLADLSHQSPSSRNITFPTLFSKFKVKLFLRAYHKRKNEWQAYLLSSLKMLCKDLPPKTLIFVLDADSVNDQQWGDVLQNEWPYPTVDYQVVKSAIGGGHAMQQGSYLYADKHVNDEETFILMLDTDATLISALSADDVFDDNGRPHCIVQVGNPQNKAWHHYPQISHAILKSKVFVRGMAFFPVVVKAKHLRMLREHVSALHGGRDFDDIWRHERGSDTYELGAFDIITNYLFFHHFDEYAFHVQRRDGASDPSTPDPKVCQSCAAATITRSEGDKFLSDMTLTRPRPRCAVHAGYDPRLGHIAEKDVLSEEKKKLLRELLERGWCLSGGILQRSDHDPTNWSAICPKYSLRQDKRSPWDGVEYSFERSDWRWDPRTVDALVEYYRRKWTFMSVTGEVPIAQHELDRAMRVMGLTL